MEKTAAVTVCLLWLLLLFAVSTPEAAQGDGDSSPSTFLVPRAEATAGSWTTKTSMPTGRIWLGVAVVDGKIYAIGGKSSWDHYLNTNEMYDPATDRWFTKKPMPTPRAAFGIAVYQNKIYVIGGADTEGLTGVNQVYDPLTDTWEIKTRMPTPRVALCANVVDGKIYLTGGRTGGAFTSVNVTEVYDPATDTWTTKTPMPYAVEGYASAVVDNKIYVIGGIRYSSVNLTQIYTPETDTWSYGAPMPIDVAGAAGATTTGVWAPKRIYVMGDVDIFPNNFNQIYDPENNAWSTGTPMPTARGNLGVAVVDDVLYAIGGGSGWVGVDLYLRANEQYTPVGYGTVPPTISIVSPENKTYASSNVPLAFTVNKPTTWVGYSLDGQETVPLAENTTLTGLSNGSHSVTVQATDKFGNTGSSETIHFTVAQKTEPLPSAPFPTTWIVAAIAIIATGGAIALGLAIYRRKRASSSKTP